MKVLVIENEYASLKNSFDFANAALFNNDLQITNVEKSQDVSLDTVEQYVAIFIDISLATKSLKDGFGIIRDIIEKNDTLAHKLVILTGNNNIEEKIRENKLDKYDIKIVYKPISYQDIASAIRESIECKHAK